MTALAERLRQRIRREGPIPFRDFMEAALYDPQDGYYARGPPIGPEGDFSTSASFEAFRLAVARLARAAHDALGRPNDFRVVELGAGTGLLARTIRDRWREEMGTELDYVTVEASPALRRQQEARAGVRAVARAADVPPGPCLVFGNEVLDALPVHRVLGTDDGLLEVFVDVDPRTGRFRERLRPPSTPELAAHFARLGLRPQRGQLAEVSLALAPFVRAAASLPDPGFLVFIDYGDPAPALYDPRRINGTLAVYKAHGKHHDWTEGVGERDITADVDFTTVALAATEKGMEEMGLATQQEFLEALGIHDLGLPDEARLVAGAAGLGTAFHVAAFRRGAAARLPGFEVGKKEDPGRP